MNVPEKSNSIYTSNGVYLGALACHHCSQLIVQPALVHALGCLQQLARSVFIVTCCYRCPAHNAAVGGAPSSQHLIGNAVDLVPKDGDLHKLAADAAAAGFTWTLIESDHLHADTRGVV